MLNKLKIEIEKMQKGHEGTDVFFCGEQLKDIVGNNAKQAEIVLKDFEAGMDIKKCAAEIKKLADQKKKNIKGNCVVVSPKEAEEVIRKYYGLNEEAKKESLFVDLEDIM